jgi:hypothetical protein
MGARFGRAGGAWLGAILILLAAADVRAKAWKSCEPGKTTRNQVIEKYGEPAKAFSKGGKLSDGLSYQGKQAIEGALEADFFFDKHGVLFRIDVFPSQDIDKKQILEIYGKAYAERVTKTGHVYFDYTRAGMVVFFQKESEKVQSFVFTVPVAGDADGGSP